MESEKHPSFFPVLISGLVFGVLGWAGMVFVTLFTDPELGPRWLFYFCLTLAVSGTSLPIIAFLNRRFPSTPLADEGVLLRQAIWVGVFASLIAWLQAGRALNLTLGVFIGVSLILIEALLRMNERSRFNPGKEGEHE